MDISEAGLKRTCEDYLTYKMNAGELVYLRLNSGDFIEVRGNTRRRIKGCQKGTADLMVIRRVEMHRSAGFPIFYAQYEPQVIFLELKSAKGKQRPEQGAFQLLIESQGASYHIVRSIEQLISIIGVN